MKTLEKFSKDELTSFNWHPATMSRQLCEEIIKEHSGGTYYAHLGYFKHSNNLDLPVKFICNQFGGFIVSVTYKDVTCQTGKGFNEIVEFDELPKNILQKIAHQIAFGIQEPEDLTCTDLSYEID